MMDILEEPIYKGYEFHFFCSNDSPLLSNKGIKPIVVKDSVNFICDNYQLLLSLHCKQLFPKSLVNKVRCINVHPGYNPYNRGWYPQVFSIINKLPVGATIHEIDEELDHGPIIVQEEVPVFAWDTSLDVYNRVVELELKLLNQHLLSLLRRDYSTHIPSHSGNLNLKKNFKDLCFIDQEEFLKVEVLIDKLRALSHGDFKNAYFIDKTTNKKVYIKIDLKLGE